MYLCTYVPMCLLVGVLILSSCTKESISSEKVTTFQEEITSISSQCATINDCQNGLCILSDSEDPENHRINMILFHYASAIRELSSIPELADLMIESMTVDVNSQGVSIPELAEENAFFATLLNEALRNSIQRESIFPKMKEDFDIDGNLSDYLSRYFTYLDDEYVPAIYFVKHPEPNNNSKINVFIGEEASDCDEVIGWIDDLPILSTEEEIIKSKDVNVFVGVGEILDQNNINADFIDVSSNDLSERSSTVNVDYTLYQIKKGHRYERSNNSEVFAGVVSYYPTDPNSRIMSRWFEEDVHKNDINASKIFEEQDLAIKMPLNDFDRFREVFVYSWENDWWASGKSLKNSCSNHDNHQIAPHRKFLHEWYFNFCGDLNQFVPNVNQNFSVASSKCRFDFLRTQ